MAPDSFHFFPSLPFELRRMIYLLASPPRFVVVYEETEDKEAFEERFRTTPMQLTLHPNLVHFAHNWRDPHEWSFWRPHRQSTLDAFGFQCPRPKHQPWVSTRLVPDIPHYNVSESVTVAWEFVREGWFWSLTPIPPLLHVTSESRQVLMDDGYELAFRTRTCGPRIWFNFKIDILYIIEESPFYRNALRCARSLLSGNTRWDLGQFDPLELRRIKRLALNWGADAVCTDFSEGLPDISNILQLFRGVEELFLEETFLGSSGMKTHTDKQPNDSKLWLYTPVLEIDVLASTSLYAGKPFSLMTISTGASHNRLKTYKEENMGDGSRYFIDAARDFELSLASRMTETVRRDSCPPWKIPKVHVVHIGDTRSCRGLFKWRWAAWDLYLRNKEEDAMSEAAEAARRSIDVPSRPIHPYEPRPLSPFSEEFQDDLEVYNEYYRMEMESWEMENIAIHRQREREQERWFWSGIIAPPENVM